MKRRSLFSGSSKRKGNVFVESIFIVIAIFIFAIVIIFGNKLSADIDEQIQQDTSIDNSTKEVFGELNERHGDLFDGLFLTMLVLLWIGAMISAWTINSHPIFFAIMIFLLIFGFIVFAVLSNTFIEITASEDLVEASENFPITMWFWNHSLLVITFIVASILITTYTGVTRE